MAEIHKIAVIGMIEVMRWMIAFMVFVMTEVFDTDTHGFC